MHPRTPPRASVLSLTALVLLALANGGSLSAQSLYWDADDTTPGAGSAPSGTWGVDAFWNTDAAGGPGAFSATTGSGNDLFLVAGPSATSGNAAYAISLPADQSGRSLNLQASGALSLAGAGMLTLGSGGLQLPAFAHGAVANGAATLAVPVQLAADQVWTNASANAVTLTGGLLGGFTLGKAGAGVLNVTQLTSPAHVDTVILGGRVQYNNASTSGTFQFGTGTVRVDNGGRFHLNASAGSLTLTNPITVGTGGETISTPSSTGRTYTFSGGIHLAGPVTLGQVDGGGGGATGGVFSGQVVIDQASVGTRRITLSSGGNHGPTLSGNIVDGPGSAANPLLLRTVDSNNGRDVTVTGANTYAGDTVIQGLANGSAAGRFLIAAPSTPNTLALGAGNIAVDSGAHLRLGANAILAAGKRVTVTATGNQATTIGLARDVDPATILQAGSSGTFTFNLDAANTTPVIDLSSLTTDGRVILGTASGQTVTFGGQVGVGADALYRFGAGGSVQGAGGALQLSATNALTGNNSLQVGGWYGNTGREGHGTLALNAANDFVGDVQVAAGNSQAGSALVVRNRAALGDPGNLVRLATSAANGPILRLEYTAGIFPNPLVLTGTGTATLTASGMAELGSGLTQEDASTLTIGIGTGVIALTAPATAPTGKTAVSGGTLSLSNANQIGDGNLALNTLGTLVFNGLTWTEFSQDRSAGYGTGANQWQFGGGGFAARGQALLIDATGTTDTTFDTVFTLGSSSLATNGLPYADAPVVLDRGAGPSTLLLSATQNRALHVHGASASGNSSIYALKGPTHTLAGKISGGGAGRRWHLIGPNTQTGLGEVRISNPQNDFQAEVVLAGNQASPPDAGSGVLVLTDDRALGHPTNVVTLVSSSPSGGGSGWMVLLEDVAGSGQRFSRSLVNESRGSPSAPPVGLGSFSGHPVFTGSITVRNQTGNNTGNNSQSFNFQTLVGSTLTLGTSDDPTDLAGNRPGTSTQVWRKTGPGTLVLANVNIANASGTHTYQIYEGALREAGSGATNSLNNARLIFTNAGVLETRGVFNRPLGSTNPGEVSWSNGAGGGGLGGGGFAAQGGPLTVDLNATDANLEWTDANFIRSGALLVFGSQTANDRVTLVDNLGLAAADNTTAVREILVVDNPDSSGDVAEISGRIHNRGGGGAGGTGTRGLLKSGSGTLVLSGANTYNGTTTISVGILVYNGSLGASPNGLEVQSAGTLAGTGTLARPVTVQGVLAPAGNEQGVLTVGGLTFSESGTLKVGLGAVAGADRVVSTGDVTLSAGADVLPQAVGGAATNSVHVILENQGANPVAGTFSRAGNELSENEVFSVSGLSLRISYLGGDGNDVTLTVLSSAPSTTYATWISGFPTLPPGETDAEDDFDQDGQNNLVEYFAAQDPTVVNPPMMTAHDATATRLRFHFRRGTDSPDLAYTLEWSENFQQWFAPDAQHVFAEEVTGFGTGYQTVQGTLTVPAATTRLYARIRINRLP